MDDALDGPAPRPDGTLTPYRRLGVEKNDERRVIGVDHGSRAVLLDGSEDGLVLWKPAEIGGRRGGTEVNRAEGIELCVGDRIRGLRNDGGSASSIARPRR